MLKFTDYGLMYLLDSALSGTSNDLILRLFSNNIVPTQDTEIGAMVEATFTGYTESTLDNALFSAAVMYDDKAQCEYEEIEYTNSSASQTIYGYYLVYDDELVATDRFQSPRVVATSSTIRLTPVLTLQNEF